MNSLRNPSSAEPSVTFWGAAETVTGSMHLVDFAGQRILLDCGLHRGEKRESRSRNETFPFDPKTLDAVILSHAHADHCGNLPNLVRQGFGGPIFCTPATRDLVGIMLRDSARVREEDAVVARIVDAGKIETTPAYTRGDAAIAASQCVPVRYGETAEVGPGISVRLIDAGHILGSAIVALTLTSKSNTYRITFTGDLGRRSVPFLPEPSVVPEADLLICESTYGNRSHDSLETMETKVGNAVRTTISRGGKVLVPAFSLGRTQLVVHFLQRWMRKGSVPVLPIYVDSPLAAEIAKVYDRYPELMRSVNGPEVPPARYVVDRDEALELSTRADPCIIVASGGMCDGGRIVQHLRHHIDDPRTTIMLVSYQAPQSLGAQLLEHRPTVRFHGRTWNKWAQVVEVNGFSGHADRGDFVALLGAAAAQTRQVRLVHGEPEQAKALAQTLQSHGFREVAPARRGETVRVA